MPVFAALDGPVQNARQLGSELALKVLVLLCLRDIDHEWNQLNASPDAAVATADRRLVVASNKKLELRQELKELLVMKARRE